MKECTMIRRILLTAALVAPLAAFAVTKTYQSPPDIVMLKASTLPGYARAQAVCASCHSAEYMLYQPASAPRAYWDTMVKRMKAVFKAPVDDADIPVIVDYLAKTYGNEQAR
jgi:mono/diheme cytochrome c family protein